MKPRHLTTAAKESKAGNPSAEAPTIDTGNQIREYQRQLRRLASELSLTEARERREIASDLHDHIGQALAYVSQKVVTLKGNAVFSGMENEFSEILSILNQAIKYTRDLTVEISPPVLYELGLSAAVDWLAERDSQRYKLKIDHLQSGAPRELAEEIKVFVFKSIQELIANSAKHARADRVEIHTNWLDDKLVVVVSDDGRGFVTTQLGNCLADANSFGLFRIKERLSYIGGELTIESEPDNGTKVTFWTGYDVVTEER